MLDYRIHVNGKAEDAEKGFKCGFDISVINGGDAAAVGEAVQTAIDMMHARSKEAPKKED